MKRKIIISLNVLTFFILSSCTNLLNPIKTTDISFTLGNEVASEISKAVATEVTDDTEFEIKCSFEGIPNEAEKITVKKVDLENAKIEIKDIPFEVEFKILIDVLFNNHVIFQGKSNTIILDSTKDGLNVNVLITPRKSKITYENNGGTVKHPETVVEEYFISDKITVSSLPKVSKKGHNFKGWYLDKECTKPVVELGQDYFVGDVTLYAKWDVIIPDVAPRGVTDVAATVVNNEVKITWKNPADTDLSKIMITCKEDESFIKDVEFVTPLGNGSTTVTGFANSKEKYHFILTAVDKNKDQSKNKSAPVEAPEVVLSKIPDFTIPDFYPNCKVSVADTAKDIIKIPVTGFSGRSFDVSSSNNKVTATAEIVANDLQITVDFTDIKTDVGEYDITITTLGDSVTKTFNVRDNYKIGDVIYANKTTPVAVLFRGGTVGSALGVSLIEGEGPWGNNISSSDPLRKSFLSDILSPSNTPELYATTEGPTGNGGKIDLITISGDDTGSDNWEQARGYYIGVDVPFEGDAYTLTEENVNNDFKAYYYAATFGTNNYPGTVYAAEWFMPSLKELCELYKCFADTSSINLDEIITSVNGTSLNGKSVWSASCSKEANGYCCTVVFSDGTVSTYANKGYNYKYRPVHFF